MGAKFLNYSPTFKGPVPPEDSIRDVLRIVSQSSVAKEMEELSSLILEPKDDCRALYTLFYVPGFVYNEL